MMKIILIGSRSDKRIVNALEKAFKDKCSFIRIAENKIVSQSEIHDFIIIETSNISRIQAKNSIVIFKEIFEPKTRLSCCDESAVIADTGNSALIDYITGNKLKAITCGLSSCDTITLSSITGDSAVVSLQRAIKNLSGDIIEPFEVPVKLNSSIDRYTIMAVCAVFILSSKIQHLDIIEI